MEILAQLVEGGVLGDDAGFLLGEISERIRELRQVGPWHLLGGRCEERSLHAVEHDALGLQHAIAVLKPAHLFLQGTELVLEFLHAGIGREIDVGLLARHIQDEGLGGALAADLKRVLVEGLGQVDEREFGDATGQLDAARAGNDGAVGVNCDRGDGRVHRHRRGGDEEGRAERAEGGEETFHGGEGSAPSNAGGADFLEKSGGIVVARVSGP